MVTVNLGGENKQEVLCVEKSSPPSEQSLISTTHTCVTAAMTQWHAQPGPKRLFVRERAGMSLNCTSKKCFSQFEDCSFPHKLGLTEIHRDCLEAVL